MKKNEKILILALLAITILVIIIAVVNNKKEDKEGTNVEEQKYVEVLEDGTKLNNSTKLQETKKIDGMEITNLQLTQKDNLTVLLGTITNKTKEVKGDYLINIKVVDEKGNEIKTVTGYIGQIAPGESKQLNCAATFDYSNAYDVEITKK